ncbi:MAG: helix-turn-helix domain-containing protein [Kiritimatiellaeota bacterium]|nr:helix-turn-helix domain-containing protein [Kiritimatiellota bacterium]
MSNPINAVIPLETLARVLNDPVRWMILRELAKGEALPVVELGRRTGRSANMTSKHMMLMRAAGLVVAGYGRLYSLAPAVRPAPGATKLDLGHCHLILDVPGKS